ncbi:aminodeoxychorismate/anthranilate synthase component II [Saccharothrix deserti]|uniref:aminodeoxychorismate/anthranilate synthase component II n=1 Tax=Saccharothrix deserti TaxID=2593674 RepID=UPI00236799DE|nr:aminodeoxychorismate/anthranilate synthase component II [Saccharothrix deserti]
MIDAEDTFTAMPALQLRSPGPEITVRRFDEPLDLDGYDVVLVGPGPGDPRDDDSAKIAVMRHVTGRLLDERRPFLSVCLGHQVLSGLFGSPVTAGFCNTFAARSAADTVECPGVPGPVAVSRDPDTGEVHALRGPRFASVQFHAESVLTEHGPTILGDVLTAVLAGAPVAR